MKITPLEAWIAGKIGSKGRLNREELISYQIRKLRDTVALVQARSRFYAGRLSGISPGRINSLDDLRRIPFTTAEQLREFPLSFLCVTQDEINRVVTLPTSGTTGQPKRLFFTGPDQELTIDFFRHGMSTLVHSGDRVLILLPGERPGSVGDLLQNGLSRMGAEGIVYGPVFNALDALQTAVQERINSMVGIPTQVLALARFSRVNEIRLKGLKNVLLSTDYVPDAIAVALTKEWGCRVFNHYGMTEMGLGGGVECEALAGYHLREADLLFEVVDPVTSEPVPEGEQGEVVFTTLTRTGMPLLRYRTGDISRFIPEPCSCGTVLKRLERVAGRLDSRLTLTDGDTLTLQELDEALFRIEGLLDFRVTMTSDGRVSVMQIEVGTLSQSPGALTEVILAAKGIPVVSRAVGKGSLRVTACIQKERWSTNGVSKRKIIDCRNRHGQF